MKKWMWLVLMIGIGFFCLGVGFATAFDLNEKVGPLCTPFGVVIASIGNLLLRDELKSKY